MQTPAPFEYERATSVEGAIASLQRLGPEARIIAGGHSLLPMMKLRLASPEHLVDINDLARARLHPRAGRRDPDRRADPPRRPAALRAARAPLPAVRRRRAGDRRPRRAQPRHDRRLALPGRRRRGPLGRLRGGQGRRRDPRRATASASCAMEDFHVGPYTTAVNDGELLTEVRLKVRPGAGSAHEKVERRAGDWAIAAASAALWFEDRTIADAGIALSAVGITTDPPDPRRGAAARQDAVGGAVRAGGADRLRGLLAERRRPRARRLQAPSRRRADRARAATARRTAPTRRRPERERVDHRQRRAGLARGRAAPAARALPARDARPDRHALGLRHLQLRRLRGAARRQAGEVLHDPRRRWPRATRSAPSSRSRSTASSTRSSRASTSCTRCSAASAPRGCR